MSPLTRAIVAAAVGGVIAGCPTPAERAKAGEGGDAGAGAGGDASAGAGGYASSGAGASADAGVGLVGWQLRCLAKHYGGAVEGEALVTARGERVALSAGPGRSFDARMEAPSAEDVFVPRYSPGTISAVGDPEMDPGRFRPLALFRAAYGATPAEIERGLVAVDFVGKKIRVHGRAKAAFAAASARLERAVAADPSLRPFFEGMGGTYNYRPIAGTERLSAHAFGIALDIATARSHYWRNDGARPTWKNAIPQAIVDAFEASGFAWGGRWYHYDTMHFEWRPELFDPECRPK